MNAQDAANALAAINGVITAINPLLGTVIGLGEFIAGEIRQQGGNIGPFADEIARFEALRAAGGADDDAWRARHGLPAWNAQQQPHPAEPMPQPASGDLPTFPRNQQP